MSIHAIVECIESCFPAVLARVERCIAHRMARRMVIALALAWTSAPMVQAQEAETGTAGAQTEEPAVPFLGGFLTETRVLYPLRLEGWIAQGEHRYEMAELGASVRYKQADTQGRWLDVYFYPSGLLPEGRLQEDATRTLEEIAGVAGEPGGYESVDAGPLQRFEIEPDNASSKLQEAKPVEAWSASLRFVTQGKAYHSALVMLVKDLYYVKGRLSVPEADMTLEEVRHTLETRMGELVRMTTFVSTGRCWNPPPIVKRPVLDAEAPGIVAKATVDGRLGAVAFADRVEVLENATTDASILPLLAATMTGRHVPGCHPPEDLTPSVPEGMREMRFEYRAPNEESDGSGPRLRGQRIGVG